jgi:outer membrane protein OmpA-like peptidoglycan-associated protein
LGCGVAVFSAFGGLVFSGAAMAQQAQGQFSPDATAPIQLHMPVQLHMPAQKRAPARRKPAAKHVAPATTAGTAASTGAAPIPFGSAAPAASTAKPVPQKSAPVHAVTATPPASHAERRKAVKEVLAAPASTTATSDSAADVNAPGGAIPFSFDSNAPPPPPAKPKAPPPPPKRKQSSAARPHTDVATLEQPPKEMPAKEIPAPPKPKGDPHAGMTKKGEVLFAGTDIDPQSDSADALKAMAGDLNAAIDSHSGRVELEAFGGNPGDKSSESRRLSLRRALAIRQLLIDKGIPASRIDVKAMGGVDDHGNADRVDVWLRGAG